MKNYIFTSESVTAGHPDKICDRIADTILDEALKQDSDSHMAVEATIKDNLILVYGEANTKANINYEDIALSVLKDIGYIEKYEVIVKVNKQSQEINKAVNKNKFISAGDQGIMFGFACNDNEDYMPAPIYYAHKLAKQLERIRVKYPFLGPDGKTQVSVEYVDDKVKRIDTILVSIQHKADISQGDIYKIVMENVIKQVIPSYLLDSNTKYIVNPSGSFIVGGSYGDSGTTGRKIVCDTYGGMGKIGGGCFSSKDPSKVDRSAAYYCRYVAKNIVAHKLADKCELQVAYAIGKSHPISLMIDTFNSEKISKDRIMEIINRNFNFNVASIIEELDLKKPIYRETSCYGHFGRKEFSWEKIKELV